MPEMVKVLFLFEDSPIARDTLARALEDLDWLDKEKRPTLEVGFGMMEQEALFILSKATGQHGARLLVVAAPKKEAKSVEPVKKEPEVKPVPKKDVPPSKSKESK